MRIAEADPGPSTPEKKKPKGEQPMSDSKSNVKKRPARATSAPEKKRPHDEQPMPESKSNAKKELAPAQQSPKKACK